MKKSSLLLPAALMLAHAAFAQQQFNAPQLLNPAMTGFTPADVRASYTLGSNLPWAAPSMAAIGTFAADAPVLKGKLPKGDALGIGIASTFSSFSAGDNYSYSSRSIGLSAAYHKALGKKKDQYLSLGVTGSVNSWETNTQPMRTGYMYKAGAMYTRPLTTSATFYAGYAYTGSWSTHNLYAGGVWNVNKRLTLNATVLSELQPVENFPLHVTYALTTMAGYTLNPDSKKPTTLYLGGTYEYRHHIAPYVGIEKWGFRLAVSPHLNIGPYSSGKVSAADISLLWLGRFKKHSDKQKDARPLPKIY